MIIVKETALNKIRVANSNLTLTVKKDVGVKVITAGIQGFTGAKGDSGVAGAAYVQLTADVSLGGHRVIIATATGCNYADKDDLSHVDKVIGLTQSAFNSGSTIEVFTAGEITENSWNWQLGAIYLGNNGLLTQTIPTTGFLQIVATAISSNKLVIDIQSPIIL